MEVREQICPRNLVYRKAEILWPRATVNADTTGKVRRNRSRRAATQNILPFPEPGMPMPSRRPGLIRGLALLAALVVGGLDDARAGEPLPETPPKTITDRLADLAGDDSIFGTPDVLESSDAKAASNRGLTLLDEDQPSEKNVAGETDGALRSTLFQRPVPQVLPAPSDLPPVPPASPPADAPPKPVPSPEPLLLEPEYEIGPPVPIGPGLAPTAEPLFGEVLNAGGGNSCRRCGKRGGCRQCECGAWGRIFYLGVHEETCDFGIGHDRVMLAPFFVELTQPFNHYRAGIDVVSGLQFPDRAEYFWAAPPKGRTTPEREVNYQDLRLKVEMGGDKFSVATDLPVRLLDPAVNDNTGGFSDMNVTQKAVMVDGDYWQVSQFFRTYFNTGSARKGLGTGHISLEPGVLGRYKWNEQTYLHGELLYWFPLGGANPIFAGERLRSGVGVSTVLYETDMFAAIPTLELVGWYFYDGAKTLPDGSIVNIDGEGFVNIHPGVRFVLGPRGDLGLFEFGVAGGLGLGEERLYDSILRVELRWSY